jgi:signal transduction histidine kinase
MRSSIRFRITATALLLATVVLAATAIVVVVVLRQQLLDNLDESLQQRADTIAELLQSRVPSEMASDEDVLIQVVHTDGTIALTTTNLVGKPSVGPMTVTEGDLIHTVHDVAGRPEAFRMLTRRIDTADGQALLHLAINYDDVSDPISILSRLLAVAIPAVVVLLGVLTWWLTGRTLRPVERIRTEMAEISENDLGRRVPEPATGDEIDRLARTVNETLDRLEDVVRRHQRFVADASHELRAPLTRIRSEIEVDLAQPGEADLLATHRSVLEEAVGLQRLVDDLLHLARSDAAASPLHRELVDLDDIVLREARRLCERDQVRVDTSSISAATVTGDKTQLSRVVRNLFENAERHAASSVTMSLDEDDTVARLVVSNDGPGIPAAEVDRIFERFARLDAARSRDAGGSGLGLAIARDIVQRHGGTIRVEQARATAFIVELPRPKD